MARSLINEVKELHELCHDLYECLKLPTCIDCNVFNGEEFDCMAEFRHRMDQLGVNDVKSGLIKEAV